LVIDILLQRYKGIPSLARKQTNLNNIWCAQQYIVSEEISSIYDDRKMEHEAKCEE
jgi:hypothetical protein